MIFVIGNFVYIQDDKLFEIKEIEYIMFCEYIMMSLMIKITIYTFYIEK
jgi:hypothetical protein